MIRNPRELFGPLARYWGMTLANTDGGFASVKDMRLVPNVTTRRI